MIKAIAKHSEVASGELGAEFLGVLFGVSEVDHEVDVVTSGVETIFSSVDIIDLINFRKAILLGRHTLEDRDDAREVALRVNFALEFSIAIFNVHPGPCEDPYADANDALHEHGADGVKHLITQVILGARSSRKISS